MNNMTHELRTPLNSIMGFSNILKSQPGIPQKWQDMVNHIHGSGTQLLTLISDIIDFVELDSRQLNIQLFSLYDVISATAHGFKKAAEHKKLSFEVRVDNSAILYGDPKRLGVALRHLLDNAIKFTEQGSVVIECQMLSDNRVNICVRDTGQGINLADINNLNQSFVQAEQGLNRSKEGVGLGLAIVERICGKWGGKLHFGNLAPQGTEVIMQLPSLKPCDNAAY